MPLGSSPVASCFQDDGALNDEQQNTVTFPDTEPVLLLPEHVSGVTGGESTMANRNHEREEMVCIPKNGAGSAMAIKVMVGLLIGVIVSGLGGTFYAVRWGGQMETKIEALVEDAKLHRQHDQIHDRFAESMARQDDIVRRVVAAESSIEAARLWREDYLQRLERRLTVMEGKLDLALKVKATPTPQQPH